MEGVAHEFIDTDGGKNRKERERSGPIGRTVNESCWESLTVGNDMALSGAEELYYGEFDPGSG